MNKFLVKRILKKCRSAELIGATTPSMRRWLIKKERKLRAIAPVIATLLMVAIAVLGGIIIFVFVQGFFSETDVGQAQFEKLNILGYDLRDQDNSNDLIVHDGTQNTEDNGVSTDGDFGNTDYGAVYIENLGDGAIAISKVTIGASTYVLNDGTPVVIDGDYPGAGNFVVCTGGSTCADTDMNQAGIVDAFSKATLIVEKDSTGIDLKNGRGVSIVVETDSGGAASVSAVVGTQRGA